jgi:hypothetical protein
MQGTVNWSVAKDLSHKATLTIMMQVMLQAFEVYCAM